MDQTRVSRIGGQCFNLWASKSQMYKLDLQKAEKPEIKLPISIGSQKKQENSTKTSTSALLITSKTVIDYVDQNKLWKIL